MIPPWLIFLAGFLCGVLGLALVLRFASWRRATFTPIPRRIVIDPKIVSFEKRRAERQRLPGKGAA